MGQAGQQRSRQKKICNKKKVKSVKPTVEKKAPKLRKKIQPGQVLILLASKFRGKRVVFLKQLESGMLLVTGPFALNGVPLKRVNQRYCIATSTKVDVSGADCKSITDAYFGREKTKSAKSQEKFFATEAPKKVLAQEKKDGQKKLDDAIVKSLGNDVKSYLKSRFSLSANMYPHELKF
mmetsp:Transcript_2948/g.6763  ORF Transcript_2948/g.6763 Transcript_2948/m.6763 type:complete len:179 (+) Transcript_2948:64-600(+)